MFQEQKKQTKTVAPLLLYIQAVCGMFVGATTLSWKVDQSTYILYMHT